jgi:predicted membrane-bound mannosyltransferase
MNTTINKALVAIIGGAIILANSLFNTDWVVDEAMINSIAAVVTPILVYLVPNKAAA